MKFNLQYKVWKAYSLLRARRQPVALRLNNVRWIQPDWLMYSRFRKGIEESEGVMEKSAEESVEKRADVAVKGEAAIKPQ